MKLIRLRAAAAKLQRTADRKRKAAAEHEIAALLAGDMRGRKLLSAAANERWAADKLELWATAFGEIANTAKDDAAAAAAYNAFLRQQFEPKGALRL